MEGVSAGLLGGITYILIRSTIKKFNGWLKYVVLFFMVFLTFLIGSTLLAGKSISLESLSSIKFWLWLLLIYTVLAFFESVPYLDKKLNGKE